MLLDRETEEMARGSQESLESQVPQPWIFRRNRGFPMGWTNGLEGEGNGNDQQTAQGQVPQSKDVNVLAIFSLLPPSPESHEDADREESGGVSSASSF